MNPLLLMILGAVAIGAGGRSKRAPWTLRRLMGDDTRIPIQGALVTLQVEGEGGVRVLNGQVVGIPTGPIAQYTILIAPSTDGAPNPAGFEVGKFISTARGFFNIVASPQVQAPAPQNLKVATAS